LPIQSSGTSTTHMYGVAARLCDPSLVRKRTADDSFFFFEKRHFCRSLL
jgi:hypothetical protein